MAGSGPAPAFLPAHPALVPGLAPAGAGGGEGWLKNTLFPSNLAVSSWDFLLKGSGFASSRIKQAFYWTFQVRVTKTLGSWPGVEARASRSPHQKAVFYNRSDHFRLSALNSLPYSFAESDTAFLHWRFSSLEPDFALGSLLTSNDYHLCVPSKRTTEKSYLPVFILFLLSFLSVTKNPP